MFNADNDKSITELKAKFATFSEDQWLYYTDFELWTWDGSAEKIINRFSKEIQQAIWYPKNEYVIFSLDNTIMITEIDTRDITNQYELLTGQNINSLAVDPKGQYIFYTTNNPTDNGLYALEIWEKKGFALP